MGLMTPNFPPVDPATFLEKPYLERIKALSRSWVENGFGAPKITPIRTGKHSENSTSEAPRRRVSRRTVRVEREIFFMRMDGDRSKNGRGRDRRRVQPVRHLISTAGRLSECRSCTSWYCGPP